MQKQNSVIKNYILSSEIYLLEEPLDKKERRIFIIKGKNVKIRR